MPNSCEVCDHFRPGFAFGRNYRVVRVEFDARPVHLCVGHARIAENSGVNTFEQLRELYGSGRRSFVPRRNPSGMHEGLPRSLGRRSTDCASV